MLGVEVGATSGRIPGKKTEGEGPESLSGEWIRTSNAVSQSSLELVLGLVGDC